MKQQQFDAREEMQRLLKQHPTPVSAAVKARLDSAIAVLEPGNA
jgi:exonuclease SbcC